VFRYLIVVVALGLWACDDEPASSDAGPAPSDARGVDATARDTGAADALPMDSGLEPDSGTALVDSGPHKDSGPEKDAGPQKDGGDGDPDTGPTIDSGFADGGSGDGGNSGRFDSGDPDATVADATTADSGPADSGAGIADAGVGAAMGSWVAFNSKRFDNQWDLFVVRGDGTGVTRITTDQARDLHPAWSPDGRRLAFSSRRGADPGIWVATISTATVSALVTSLTSEGAPAWSPNGTTIAFEARPDPNTDQDVYVIDANGTGLLRLTDASGKDAGPVWSAAGGTIYFVSNRTGRFEAWRMDADGDNETQITTNSGILGRVTADPDGQSIAYTRLVPGTQRSEVIRYMLADGSITSLTAMDDSEPHFSPDGTKLVCTTFRFGNAEVISIELASGTVTRLTDHPSLDTAPAFGP